MKTKLNVSERVFALSILNAFKGSYEILAFVLDDVKQIAITNADWEKAERKIIQGTDDKGNPTTSWVWDDAKGGEKEIEISDQGAEYIKTKIDEKNKAGEFTLQDKAVVTLAKKLGK